MFFNKKEYTIAQKVRNSTLLVQFISLIFVLATVFTHSFVSTNVKLKRRAVYTTKETIEFLKDPLFNLDENQIIKIGETLLISDFIENIKIESDVFGTIYDSGWENKKSNYLEIEEPIIHNNLFLGKLYISYTNYELNELILFLIIFSIAIFIAVYGTSFFIYQFVISKKISRPIETLLDGLKLVEEGNYSHRFFSTGFLDLNNLARGINDMSNKIQLKQKELVEVNNSLEKRVEKRTEELKKTLSNLEKTQDKLIDSAKMSALGYITAGIAHDINTPLAALNASNNEVSQFLLNLCDKYLNTIISLDTQGLQLFIELLDAIQTNKPSLNFEDNQKQISMQLKAQLEWEEIPNSEIIANILPKLKITQLSSEAIFLLNHRDNKEIVEILYSMVKSIHMASITTKSGEKASSVVSAIKFYLPSKKEKTIAVVNLKENVDRILTLMKTSLSNITLTKDLQDVSIIASSEDLGQIWMNLLSNSIDSINEDGQIFVRIYSTEDTAFVEIEDNGEEITEEEKEKIFEPFYSTRTDSHFGVGLNLSKRLVEQNNGEITFSSSPDKTIFKVSFPIGQ